MSAETLAVLGSAVTILVAMFAGFGWVISRMDRRFEAVDRRFEVVDRRFEAAERDVAGLKSELALEFAGVRGELSEIKIAIARLEGPTPRLIQAR